MRLFSSKVGAMGIPVVLAALSVTFSTRAAEHRSASMKKTVIMNLEAHEVLSLATLNPGDVAEHELGQQLAKQTRTSSDPDWNIQALVYTQWDFVEGNGVSSGHAIYRHPNGDESYLKFEAEASEGTFEGRGTFTGGTGRFANIKGTVNFKGTLVPEFSESFEAQVEY